MRDKIVTSKSEALPSGRQYLHTRVREKGQPIPRTRTPMRRQCVWKTLRGNTGDNPWGAKNGHDEGFAEGRAEGRAEGEAIGLEKGKEAGKLEERTENARRMKECGVDSAIISTVTGLTLSEIEAL